MNDPFEAAARALHAHDIAGRPTEPTQFEELPETLQANYRDMARAAIRAWQEATAACDGDSLPPQVAEWIRTHPDQTLGALVDVGAVQLMYLSPESPHVDPDRDSWRLFTEEQARDRMPERLTPVWVSTDVPPLIGEEDADDE